MTQHLFILQPVAVAWGQINGSWDEVYPTLEIPITSVSTLGGADFDDVVEPGMLITFGSTQYGDDLGRQRIRRVFGDSSVLIGRSSRGILDGEVMVEADDYFAIWADFRVWAKMPWIHEDGTEFKDGDFIFASHGEGVEFYPVANAGVGFANFIDPDTSVITVDFDASNSYSMPTGVGIASVLWDVGDGTITIGTSADEEITATFPPGFRWVKLSVTDDNGYISVARVPVLAEDEADPLCVPHFQVQGWNCTRQGQQIAFHVLSDIDRATYFDGTLVMFWEGEPADPGDRSHMKFIGWHHGDSAAITRQRTGTLRDTVLACLDVAGKLGTIPGLPQILAHKETPAKWSEMYQPNMLKWWHYLLFWHTTALELADWFDQPDFAADLRFIVRKTDGDTILQQMMDQVQSIAPDRIFMCNRFGQLYAHIDWNTFPVSTRTATVQADLEGYIEQITFEHTRPPRVGWIRGGGVLEQWTTNPTTIEVQYTIHVTAEFFATATSITVDPIPVDLPAGAELVFSYAQTETLSAPATAGATTLSVDPLTDTVDVFIPATVTVTEDGPAYVPTLFCIAPGLTPGQGTQHTNINNKLATNQAGLNSAVGMYYARMNAEFGLARITLADQDALGIDPGMGYWVETGDMAARYVPQRALPFFPCRGLPIELTIEVNYTDQGYTYTPRLLFERETSGPSAITIEGSI